ncbi:hypothetical protein Tdes44962_MAKER09315, partial [Teratosphaeria destructans]
GTLDAGEVVGGVGDVEAALVEGVFAEEVDGGEVEGGGAGGAAGGGEGFWVRGGGEGGGEAVAGVGAVGGDLVGVGGEVVAFAGDGVGEVGFDEGHGGDGGGGEGLDDLQRGHEGVLFDLVEHGGDFGAGVGEDLRGGGEVGEGGGVEGGFFGAVFVERADGAAGVVGGGVGAEDVGAEAAALGDEDGAVAELFEVREEEDVGGVDREVLGFEEVSRFAFPFRLLFGAGGAGLVEVDLEEGGVEVGFLIGLEMVAADQSLQELDELIGVVDECREGCAWLWYRVLDVLFRGGLYDLSRPLLARRCCPDTHAWQRDQRYQVLHSRFRHRPKPTTRLGFRWSLLDDDGIFLWTVLSREVIDEEPRGVLWFMLEQHGAVLHEVITMLLMSPGQEGGLLVVATLAAHDDGSVQIKFELAWLVNELFQLVHIFQLGVAIQQ